MSRIKVGIYKITNIVNERIYIGSTVNFKRRWSNHKSKLKSGIHSNIDLQVDFTTHGIGSFRFSILEIIADRTTLLEREQFYMDKHNNTDTLYNINPAFGPKPKIKGRKGIGKGLPHSKVITFRGKSQNIVAWSNETGIPYSTLKIRIRSGWTTEEALTLPVGRGGPIRERTKKAASAAMSGNNNPNLGKQGDDCFHVTMITFNGKTQCMISWAKETGLPYSTLKYRFRSGWDTERALTSFLCRPKLLEFEGECKSVKEWAKEKGIKYTTLKGRIRAGWSMEKALTEPVKT